MPDLQDRIYCSEQIHIPPTFPYIMKLYCKAAIRTQPYDLLKWSAAYFRALANGEEPPVKERVEYPPYDSPTGLTPGYIKILIKQFGKNPDTVITAQTLFKKWSDICLDETLLIRLIALLGAGTIIKWVNFVSVCAGFISRTLTQTMILLCELFTDEPEGGMAAIPYGLFVDQYSFLAQMECGPLTEKELQQMEEIMHEEDVCDVAMRIKQGQYEYEEEEVGEEIGEEEGERETYEPAVETKSFVEEETVAEEERIEEDYSSKGTEISSEESGEQQPKEIQGEIKEEEKGEKEGEAEKVSEAASEREEEPKPESYSQAGSRKSELTGEDLLKALTGSSSEEVVSVLDISEAAGESEHEEEEMVERVPSSPVKSPTIPKKIDLDELEDSIREKIEAKLTEEESAQEEENMLENLAEYLEGASQRVAKFTAESLGFKIFRKYMRQEVPGIGPAIDPEQVGKVIDFMDVWSNKQKQMLMPRNIRHWMCPPLDKVPTPEP